MSRTIKLKEAVENTSDSDYKEFNKQIQLLIEDENEAIDGYVEAIKVLEDKMTEGQNAEIHRVMTHIINEEKEHIKELKELKSKLEK